MRKPIATGLAAGAAVLLLLDALGARLAVTAGVIPTLPGTALWLTSRAAGVTAFLAITVQVLFGLLVSTRAADRILPRAATVELHRWLSPLALGLVAVHALALLGDRVVRFDLLDVLVPFASSYRPLAVSLGVLAGWAAYALHASFELRGRIGAKTWRRLHHLSFFAFAAALAHGLTAGSDAQTLVVGALFLTSATLVGLLVLVRVAVR